MKVFGMGLPELLIILVVVLLIWGPKNLPKLGAMVGRGVKRIRRRNDKELEDFDEDGECVSEA
ncbi:MAG: twin-arginine translocase TatA/TatE family subunit [Coriobacteriales bacterium]|jgi:sec-independent protein translocase protein TatA